MTLADAIRKGCEMREQGFADYFDQYGRSCALGAAIEGFGGPVAGWDYVVVSLRANDLHHAFFSTLERDEHVPCGCSDRPMSVIAVVTHLNDQHRWTRERIAEWLDTLD